MTAHVTRFLDQLEAAHLPAWRGTLRVGEHYGIHLYAGHDGQEPIGTALRPRDADRIVSDSNAVPQMLAAVRAGLALADEAAAGAVWSTPPTDGGEAVWRSGYAAAMRDFADRSVFTVTAELTGGQHTAWHRPLGGGLCVCGKPIHTTDEEADRG